MDTYGYWDLVHFSWYLCPTLKCAHIERKSQSLFEESGGQKNNKIMSQVTIYFLSRGLKYWIGQKKIKKADLSTSLFMFLLISH